MDWLRLLAMCFVFLVHISMPFITIPDAWLIQFPQKNMVFTGIAGFTYQWVMHLFFILGGSGTYLALQFRSARQFLFERTQRLLVPFVFGGLAFTALQRYVSITSVFGSQGNFLQFYSRMYTGCFRESLGILRIDCFASHLWFLGYLFIFSVAILPVFLLLRSGKAASLVERLTAIGRKPGGVLLIFLPTALIQVGLRARYPEHQNWSDFFLWLVYFLCGYVFLKDRQFREILVRYRYSALVVGAACMLAMSVLLLGMGYAEAWEVNPVFSLGYAFYQVMRSLNTWMWVVFFLGMGIRYLAFDHRVLRYSRQALLPFYILHQVVIVLLAYVLYSWRSPILVKFMALGCGAFIFTISIYEFLIGRSRGLQFLFGVRPYIS